jgi:thiosulfate/3-mercaptopyruvate sulfurtransferase
MTGYANPEVLVETEWLGEHLDDPAIKVIEVDEDVTAYEKGHIPGAIRWQWVSDLHNPVRRDLVDQDGMEQLLSRSGVGADDTVVLYGGNNNWFATYAYWLLKYLGFENVKLLNGGRQKWELESRELTTDVPEIEETSHPINRQVRRELRALRDEVLQSVGRAAFVDVRSPEEYRGEKLAPDHLPQEAAQVPGHIPGAANITWSKAANEDGTFKPADELREVYADVDPSAKVVTYCRIGERSSHTWFVLRELLGYGQVKNYDGSWTEYGSLVGAPVER